MLKIVRPTGWCWGGIPLTFPLSSPRYLCVVGLLRTGCRASPTVFVVVLVVLVGSLLGAGSVACAGAWMNTRVGGYAGAWIVGAKGLYTRGILRIIFRADVPSNQSLSLTHNPPEAYRRR